MYVYVLDCVCVKWDIYMYVHVFARNVLYAFT